MTKNTRTCAECGNQFTFGSGRGQARKYCNARCASKARLSREAASSHNWPVCSMSGCGKTVRSAKVKHCEAHYTRIRRNGSTDLISETSPPPRERMHSGGYVMEYAPDHPMWNGMRLYQHRRVYFDAYGDNGHRCHWCSADLTWDGLHIDHLNDIKTDNRLVNLVASCPTCNQARGAHKVRKTARRNSTAKVAYMGECLTLGQWAERLGISRTSVAWRLGNGWSVERALTEPRGVTGPR